jgi:hypothetical protein
MEGPERGPSHSRGEHEVAMSANVIVAKPKRSQPFPKKGYCSYCGSYGPLTRDHVIPKLLFEQTVHSTLIVPACRACQTGKGKGEQNLWKLVNLDIQGELHPVASKNLPVMLRDELRIQRDLGREGPIATALTSPTVADLVTPTGLFAGQAVGLKWPLEPALNTLRYTARGLYYHRYGRMLDPYSPVEVAYVPYEQRSFFGDLLKRVGWEPAIYMPTLEAGAGELKVARNAGIGDEDPLVLPDAVAVIVPLVTDEDDEPAAWWAVVFNRYVTFLLGTENYAASVASIHKSMQRLS